MWSDSDTDEELDQGFNLLQKWLFILKKSPDPLITDLFYENETIQTLDWLFKYVQYYFDFIRAIENFILFLYIDRTQL